MCSTCGCSEVSLADIPENNEGKNKTGREKKQNRTLMLEKNILEKNDAYARQNRDYCLSNSILSLNLVSSPGAGKTSLLVKTIDAFKSDQAISVIEGDQQTSHDAEKIRATGIEAIQLNTGKGCHLEAHSIGHAIKDLQLAPHSLLFIENVGNLVCPSEFDLGEFAKVLILSVTEGEDKPLKYPHMFSAASVLLINKIDLLPYVDFDMARCIQFARQVNPSIEIICLSVKTGEGLSLWLEWLSKQQAQVKSGAA